jgi:hypothetical protein
MDQRKKNPGRPQQISSPKLPDHSTDSTIERVPGLFRWVKTAGALLTTLLQLVPRLRTCGAINILLHGVNRNKSNIYGYVLTNY